MQYAKDENGRGDVAVLDACKAAREAAASLMRRAGFSAQCAHVRAAKEGFPLASPLPRILNVDEDTVLAAIQKAEAAERQLLFGAAAFDRIEAENGHILFALTDAAYSALAEAVNASCPIPPMPAETETPLFYAIARMRMLARQEAKGCPEDAAVQRALWQAIRIAEEDISLGERKNRAEFAAQQLLLMAHHIPPRERQALLAKCGSVGAAASRLLAFLQNG
ncbi:MAG: hypothetical protein E7330_02975 [Clostridiales bacterium]|nr:hypothetical protein [Clostridiales bacterium]